MPEHLRSLVVILALAALVFLFAGRHIATQSSAPDYSRRRFLWILLTGSAFLATGFWIYVAIASMALLFGQARERNPVALYLFLLFVIPRAFIDVPGFGLINYFFALSHQRLLSLCILLPACLRLAQSADTPRLGAVPADKWLIAYLVVLVSLYLRETSFTDTLRQAFYSFLDAFLPYYVISRGLRNTDALRESLNYFCLAVLVVACIAVFEFLKHWLLYAEVLRHLGLERGMTEYLGRSGRLRAIASTGQPIALGYLIAVGFGIFLYLRAQIDSRFLRLAGLGALLAGLAASLSRGPWLGALAMLVAYLALQPRALRALSGLAVAAMLLFAFLSVTPGGERVINLLPFIGATEKHNISYRQELIQKSLIVIERNPWLGSVNYLSTPEMESMRQGQGIIDIVNTYVQITLEIGLVGVALFIGFFLSLLISLYRTVRDPDGPDPDQVRLGRSLLATLTGVLLIIATVSSISIVPLVYWSLGGLCSAYLLLTARQKKDHSLAEPPNSNS